MLGLGPGTRASINGWYTTRAALENAARKDEPAMNHPQHSTPPIIPSPRGVALATSRVQQWMTARGFAIDRRLCHALAEEIVQAYHLGLISAHAGDSREHP